MQDVYEPTLQRIIPYMFCIAIIGIFMLVVMRKKFIIDYRLHFPSGTATGLLISGFHTPKGEAQARQQVTFCNALHPVAEHCAEYLRTEQKQLNQATRKPGTRLSNMLSIPSPQILITCKLALHHQEQSRALCCMIGSETLYNLLSLHLLAAHR